MGSRFGRMLGPQTMQVGVFNQTIFSHVAHHQARGQSFARADPHWKRLNGAVQVEAASWVRHIRSVGVI
jgi:hypothetical protein